MTTHKTACLPTLSRRVKGSDCSIIRDLLQLVKRPEIVSFAGGLPTADGFPIQEIDQAAHWVMDNCGREALQYSLTEGELELRRAIAQRESLNGVPTSVDEVQIVSGSQQALDLIARAFVDEGSKNSGRKSHLHGSFASLCTQLPDLCRSALRRARIKPRGNG